MQSNEQFSSADEYAFKVYMLISCLSSLLRFSMCKSTLVSLVDFGVLCCIFVGTGEKAIYDY